MSSDATLADRFGSSVAVYGTNAAIGAPGTSPDGSLYVFEQDSGGTGQWSESVPMTQYADNFGASVAIDGDLMVVGTGRIYTSSFDGVAIFGRDQGGTDNWGLVAEPTASDHDEEFAFGCSVDISGDTVIVGDWRNSTTGIEQGAAYIFQRDQGGIKNWGQVARLEIENGLAWDYDHFGNSVAIDGDIAVVGDSDGIGGQNIGDALIFYRNQGGANNWGQVVRLIKTNAWGPARFGESVAIDGDVVVVGAPNSWFVWGGGTVHVYYKDHGGTDAWGQVITLVSPTLPSARFGYSVAIDNTGIVVGSPYDDDGASRAGSAYVFRQDQGGTDNWGFVDKLLAADRGEEDNFGTSVAVDSEVFLIGAPGDDEAGFRAGAAYVFTDVPIFEELVFSSGFENGNAIEWSVMVRNYADNFNFSLLERNIEGEYIQCTYNWVTGDFSYLGQVFNEADGGIGGNAITNWIDLYWKNENLASTVLPYLQEDADGDLVINAADADAFGADVQ